MSSESWWRVSLGAILLLVVSYMIYLLRYPLWWIFTSVEQVFVMLIASYSVVLFLALFLLRKDSKKSLSSIFKAVNRRMVLFGVFFALLHMGLWYAISFAICSSFEFTSFPSLRGYENYAVYSMSFAFVLYLVFSVFGAFAEEVAYRGYVQTRLSSKYGYVVGIFVATLFFSLQHIHIFQTGWLIRFFQTQFFHVFLFGVFVGYLFFKTKENIWSVFSFHAFENIFGVSVPIVVTAFFPFANQLAEIASFMVMIMVLRLSNL
ncbi:CPBP family intramembrane metalloprotease [Candidatus Bathyarchaeota archaeon]|nr:CPBP family intramembrane metalloprotease [Candidatus Bathyarchaeota archaeon]